jgi:hypothetical protein
MSYQLASERSVTLQSDDALIGRLGPRRMLSVPGGVCHAMPVGGAKAACGRAGLILWARPWQDGPDLDRCPECLELVPMPATAAPPSDEG